MVFDHLRIISTEELRETEIQRKIRNSLKRHPEKPVTTVRSDGSTVTSMGVMARYRAVALECGCAVQAVIDEVERIIRRNPTEHAFTS